MKISQKLFFASHCLIFTQILLFCHPLCPGTHMTHTQKFSWCDDKPEQFYARKTIFVVFKMSTSLQLKETCPLSFLQGKHRRENNKSKKMHR